MLLQINDGLALIIIIIILIIIIIIIIIIVDKKRLTAGQNILTNYTVKTLHKISWGG